MDSFVQHPTFQETLKAILWRPDSEPYLELESSWVRQRDPPEHAGGNTYFNLDPLEIFILPLANCCYKMEQWGKSDSDLDCGKALGLHYKT